MLQAVAQCDAMVKLQAMEAFKKPATELTGSQDRIIDVLRKLLDITRRAQSEVLAEMKKKPRQRLAGRSQRQKLEQARAKLDKFLEQQKKIIEATENLAKNAR